MKALIFLSTFIACCFSSNWVFAKSIYVTPNGSASANGSSFTTAVKFSSALEVAQAGDSILLQGGTYLVPYLEGGKNTIVLARSGEDGKPIYLVSYNNTKAIFDFQFPEHKWTQDSYGFYVTGSYWYLKGITITNAGYQGAYVTGSHNTFNNCVFSYCRFSGLEINKGGAFTTVINCDSYNNYNPKVTSQGPGGAADGFAPKQLLGPGNVLIGCRAWGNSDDGYDTFGDPANPNVFVIMENCWAFNNGSTTIGNITYEGNKDGFKLGGSSVPQQNQAYNCIAFGNGFRGFDENNNKGGVKVFNCLAYDNYMNYSFGGTLNSGEAHDFRNNVSLKESVLSNIKSTNKQLNNTWNTGFSVKPADYKSLDLSLAMSDRSPEGTLPEIDLFRLVQGSALIDKGTATGRPFLGNAPDIGPFEYNPILTALQENATLKHDVVVFPTIITEFIHVRLLSSIQQCQVGIYSAKGDLLFSSPMETAELSIDCKDFPKGAYFVRVENDGKLQVCKVLVL